MMTEKEWLHILDTCTTSCGIAHMGNSVVAFEVDKVFGVEHLSDKTFAFDAVVLLILIDADDTASLLATMLQCVEPVISKISGIFHTPYTKYTAFFVNFVFHISAVM